MNPKQALDYLYESTVIEPTVADERAEAAIDVLRDYLTDDAGKAARAQRWLAGRYCGWVSLDVCLELIRQIMGEAPIPPGRKNNDRPD